MGREIEIFSGYYMCFKSQEKDLDFSFTSSNLQFPKKSWMPTGQNGHSGYSSGLHDFPV